MKVTAIAPSNIAFIKYFGKKEETLRLPTNGSISMNLSNLTTTTTVEFFPKYRQDEVVINNTEVNLREKERVIKQLDRVRNRGKIAYKAKVVSVNKFPKGTGLSSSASGFAALTMAASAAAGLNLNEKELSILARQASGSACRSIPDGFVEWREGNDSESSYAASLYPPDYWDLYDVVVVVGDREKELPTSEAQRQVLTSPFFPARLKGINGKIKSLKKYLKEKDFAKFGELIEEEALELHAIMLTSKPPLIYWYPETVKIMKLVKDWRRDGLPVYFTVNTGHDVHLICQKQSLNRVLSFVKKIPGVKNIIINQPAAGAKISQNHVF